MSKADAYSMTVADFQLQKTGHKIGWLDGPYCQGNHSIHESACTGFISNSEEGWAKVSIPYSTLGCYNELINLRRDYTFARHDQGWKITNFN